MCASRYNTDASFILPNTTGSSVIPWRISKPQEEHTLVPDPGHKPSDPDHSSNTFRLDSSWPHSSSSLNRFLPGVTGEFHKLKHNIFKAQSIPHTSTKSWYFNPRARNFGSINGVVRKLCLSVVKTFGAGFNICKVAVIGSVFFLEVSLAWDRFCVLGDAIPGFVEVFPREESRRFEKICRTGYFVNSLWNGVRFLVLRRLFFKFETGFWRLDN